RSSLEKRTSVKEMVAGAGLASRAISASVSGSFAPESFGLALHVGALSISPSSVASSGRRIDVPEIIEVEPIVRRVASVVSQPVGVTLNDGIETRLAVGAFHLQRFGKHFEMQLVAIAAAVQAETQHHRDLEGRGDLPWSGGKGRRLAQEIDGGELVARARPVDQQCDQRAFVERFLDG